MLNLFHRGDPAAKRYPPAMAGLLTLGKPADDADYHPWAEQLKDHAPDLIRMVLDDDLGKRDEKDPALWAPVHALRILGILGPESAAQPLTECLDWDDEWITELPQVYAAIGPAAIPVLQAYLDDSTHDSGARAGTSNALVAIAQAHPEAREAVIEHLTAFLDRPAADANADEENATTFVIGDLGDLEARSAYPAIQRAYAENRVNPLIIGLEDVEADFGLRPQRDYSKLELPTEPGVRLTLRCKVCGRERNYLFPQVYCDLGVIGDKKKLDKYGPVIIPQRVVCPKCGAVDQYEIGAMGYAAVIADALVQTKPELGEFRREDQRIQYMEFTCRWGRMHPQEAVERYQKEIAQDPDNKALHLGYGNVLRFLGRIDEAETEYQQVLTRDPDNLEAWLNLALVAQMRGDFATAITYWQRLQSSLPKSDLSAQERRLLLETAQEALADLRAGRKPVMEIGPTMVEIGHKGKPSLQIPTPPLAAKPLAQLSAPRPAAQPADERPAADQEPRRILQHIPQHIPKVGRNERCPCGSGKKYKHCHGKKK